MTAQRVAKHHLPNDLWSHHVGGAHKRLEGRICALPRLVGCQLGRTKVSELDAGEVLAQDVGGFDVAVADVLAVEVLHAVTCERLDTVTNCSSLKIPVCLPILAA